MTPPETVSTTASGDAHATAPLTCTFGPQGPTLGDLIDAYLQDYQVRQFRSRQHRSRPDRPSRRLLRPQRAGRRPDHVSDPPVSTRPARRRGGHRHHQPGDLGPPPHGHPRRPLGLARYRTRLPRPPARESPPPGLLRAPRIPRRPRPPPRPVAGHPRPRLLLRLAQEEILGLTWDEIDEAGGVIRLSPARSKTLVGRILPISPPIAEALARRRARRDPTSPLVFHRDGITIRRWRTAWRTACQAAGVPTRFLHDCRRAAARNLIRANVPERVAMLLTGHKSRAIFDRYNIIHEQELLDAGDQLVEYLAQQAQAVPARRRSHAAGPATPRTASPLRLVRRGTA